MIDDRCQYRHCRRIVVPHTEFCNDLCRESEYDAERFERGFDYEADAETRGCQQFHEAQDMELNP